MSYLIDTELRGLEEIRSWEDVEKRLREATMVWCDDSCYNGPPWEELYKEGLQIKDFGDIAQVYTIDCISLDNCDIDVSHTIKRIM